MSTQKNSPLRHKRTIFNDTTSVFYELVLGPQLVAAEFRTTPY